MDKTRDHVERTIMKRKLFRQGESVLIAVSGGVDSMALLHLLHELAPGHGWKLRAAHFNHRLRGRSSEADERLVRRVASELGLPVIVERGDVGDRASRRKCSLEMAARELRHEFLARVAAKAKATVIATAHHADDQVELFFLRLFRGSGGDGLSGMKWRSPSPANPKVDLARPLLDVPKAVLVEYARANRVDYREDATNVLVTIQRNRIRHRLVPLLRSDYQPAIERTVLRVMDLVGADAEFVNAEALNWLERRSGRGSAFDSLAVAVQRGIIRMQLIKSGIRPDYDLVERLRLSPNRPVSAPSSTRRAPDLPESSADSWCGKGNPPRHDAAVHVWRDTAGTVRTKGVPEAARCSQAEALGLHLHGKQGRFLFGGARFSWIVRIEKRRLGVLRSTPQQELFDADLVGACVTVRHWNPGDRFQPIGMTQPVKLQDLFVNLKIPQEQRRRLVIAVAERGEIFWVEGLRISERFKLTTETKRHLLWRWERL